MLLILLVAGCAGVPKAPKQLDSIRTLATTDPEAALQELDGLVGAHPRHPEVRAARARTLEALGRAEEAFAEWTVVIESPVKKNRSLLRDTHSGLRRTAESLVGSLLAARQETPSTAEQRVFEVILRASDQLARRDGGNRDALYWEACSLWRLGRVKECREALKKNRKRSKGDDRARFLTALIEEQTGGDRAGAVEVFCTLTRSRSAEARRLAANHLIQLLEDSRVPEQQRDVVVGVLVRLSRSNERVPREVRAWARGFQSEETARIRSARVRRSLQRARRAAADQAWGEAWRLLADLPADDPAVREVRAQVLPGWAEQMVGRGLRDLENHRFTAAKKIVDEIAGLADGELPPALRGRFDRLRSGVESGIRRIELKERLDEARVAILEKRAKDALAILDPLGRELPTQLQREVDVLRAEALYLWGNQREPLEILETHADYLRPPAQRLRGVLLAELGHGEEAEAVLEKLPLKYFNTQAFDGLLLALERQGKWETLLARLNTLPTLPRRYRPIRREASREAALRRLQNSDPEGAVRMLKGNLDEMERLQDSVREVFLEALLAAGKVDEATEFLTTSKSAGIGDLSGRLVDLVEEKAGDRLSDELRFELLRQMRSSQRDEAAEDFLNRTWARYGDFLPPPGNYTLHYTTRDATLNDDMEGEESSFEVVWQGSEFVVHGSDRSTERWRVQKGIWHRRGSQGALRIPVRASGRPPYPLHEFQMQGQSWTSQVIESGVRVHAGRRAYSGCLRIRLASVEDPGDTITLELAPEVGEVRRTVTEDGEEISVRTLDRIVRNNNDDADNGD
ncbi:MAG: hypothetical protein ACE5GW_03105 [Planctomycetota bacterium]